MRTLPARLRRDAVSCETYLGDGALGPAYADPVAALGRVEMLRQLVRDQNGVETVSEMTIYLDPADAAPYVPESLVTALGHTTTVITASPHSRPGRQVLTKVVCR